MASRFYTRNKAEYSKHITIIATTGFSIECVILQHPVIGSESSQILMTNNSFSSQTWAILVPKRNFDQKSMQCPTKSPESQMSKSRIFQFT